MASYFEKGRGWRYDFELYGKRHRAPRGFRTKKQSDAAERVLRDRLKGAAAGIPALAPTDSPLFQEWAGVTLNFARTRLQLDAPESFAHNLNCVLRFWGAPPADSSKRVAGAPYHNLALHDPIRDPSWIGKFEDWMTAKGLAGATKNHYRSACSRMYFVAMQPEYRGETGITMNPFRGILRDRPRTREAVFTRAQLRDVMAHLPPFLQLAVRIAVLAPKLRLGNILALTWSNVDQDLAWIRVEKHKTRRKTGRSLVTPIVPALRVFIERERQRRLKDCVHVVHWGGRGVSRGLVARELQKACLAAGVHYGLASGVTFHSLRHTAGTVMAELGLAEKKRQDILGHLHAATTQIYTHLAPQHLIEPLSQLAAEIAPAVADVEKQVPERRRRAPVTKSPRNSPRSTAHVHPRQQRRRAQKSL